MKTNFSIDKAAESWLRDSQPFYNVGMVIKESIPCFPLSKTIDADATFGVAAVAGALSLSRADPRTATQMPSYSSGS